MDYLKKEYRKNWKKMPRKIEVNGVVFRMIYDIDDYIKYGRNTVGRGYTSKKCSIDAVISANCYEGFINNAKHRLSMLKKQKCFC